MRRAPLAFLLPGLQLSVVSTEERVADTAPQNISAIPLVTCHLQQLGPIAILEHAPSFIQVLLTLLLKGIF